MKKYTYSDELISDLHKDAWGYRPSENFYKHWDKSSPDEKQSVWEDLIDDMVKHDEEEAIAKKTKAKEFVKRLKETCKLGANNYKTALKWILDAEGHAIDRNSWDAGFLCYSFGLDFKYEKLFYHVLDVRCPIKWSNGRAFI